MEEEEEEDYGYGSDFDRHESRVDATKLFFAQEHERKEQIKTARRASLGATPSYDGGYLFDNGPVVAEKQHPRSGGGNRRVSLDGAGLDGRYSQQQQQQQQQYEDNQWMETAKQSRRRGSAGFRNRLLDEQHVPRTRGRRASMGSGGGDACEGDPAPFMAAQPNRYRARRQSLNGDNGFIYEKFDVDHFVPAKQGRRLSNGYKQSSGSRRMSNGYQQQQQPAQLPPTEPQTLKFGINPDVVARMSRRMSGNAAQAVSQGLEDDDDDDDDIEYGYDVLDRGMGYGYGGAPVMNRRVPKLPKYERWGSNRSQSSRRSNASNRSQRRNSYLVRPVQDPDVMQEISCAVPPRVLDSDLEDSDDDRRNSRKVEPSPIDSDHEQYGYGSAGGYDSAFTSNDASDDQDHASDSERSMSSISKICGW